MYNDSVIQEQSGLPQMLFYNKMSREVGSVWGFQPLCLARSDDVLSRLLRDLQNLDNRTVVSTSSGLLRIDVTWSLLQVGKGC